MRRRQSSTYFEISGGITMTSPAFWGPGWQLRGALHHLGRRAAFAALGPGGGDAYHDDADDAHPKGPRGRGHEHHRHGRFRGPRGGFGPGFGPGVGPSLPPEV